MIIRPPVQTQFKLPLFNWAPLRNMQLRATIFVGMNDQAVLEVLDVERFENLFKLSNDLVLNRSGPKDSNASSNFDSKDLLRMNKKFEKKSLLDVNRHRHVLFVYLIIIY